MILLALVLAAAPAGKVSGKVTLAGLAPKLPSLPVTRDIKICGTSKPDESLVVGPGGGVKDVVVWITDLPVPAAASAAKKDAPAKKPKLDQEGCAFTPHILLVPVGTPVDIVNSDAVLHNAHATLGGQNAFNYAMPIKGHTIPTKLKKEGLYRVTCDVHPWMRAWIAVLPTAASAISKEDGGFVIDNVPPGKHHLKLWHERLGDREGDVEVAADGTATFDVQLNPR
jgi:plastocyanin